MATKTTTKRGGGTKRNGTSSNKRASVKAQASKATKAKATTKPEPTPDPMAGLTQAKLKALLADLVSTDEKAPAKGLVFVQGGRVQVRLERVAEATGATKAQVRACLVGRHGFTRQPFSYMDPSQPKGTNSASYFYSDAPSLVKGLPERERPERKTPAKKAAPAKAKASKPKAKKAAGKAPAKRPLPRSGRTRPVAKKGS